MRATFGAWRATSTAPMYTSQGSPRTAAAVAVATPCCPAPVSAMMRVLPSFFASSTCPRALLILCAPVWQRSSRLSQSSANGSVRSRSRRSARYKRRRPTDVAGEHRAPLALELRPEHHLVKRALELDQRRHQRLGHEAAAELAEIARPRLDRVGHGATPSLELFSSASRHAKAAFARRPRVVPSGWGSSQYEVPTPMRPSPLPFFGTR